LSGALSGIQPFGGTCWTLSGRSIPDCGGAKPASISTNPRATNLRIPQLLHIHAGMSLSWNAEAGERA
jgi:hypothetical protein